MSAAIKVNVKMKDDTKRVKKAVQRANVKSLGSAGAYVRGIARRSIKVSSDASAPGKPPHSRKGLLKNAIIFGVDKPNESVFIGPAATHIGRKVAGVHEFGGTKTVEIKPNFKLEMGGHGPMGYRGARIQVARLDTRRRLARAKMVAKTIPSRRVSAKYPVRSFMARALKIAASRLPREWAGSVHE